MRNCRHLQTEPPWSWPAEQSASRANLVNRRQPRASNHQGTRLACKTAAGQAHPNWLPCFLDSLIGHPTGRSLSLLVHIGLGWILASWAHANSLPPAYRMETPSKQAGYQPKVSSRRPFNLRARAARVGLASRGKRRGRVAGVGSIGG